ncbi:hypothetical protein GCM10027168_43760 [Streptomyces capparidis]
MTAGDPAAGGHGRPAARRTIGGGYYLAPPDPDPRPAHSLPAADVRRLDLHTALVTAGVPPLPGDGDAIRAVAQLDDTTVRTVIAWITSAAAR